MQLVNLSNRPERRGFFVLFNFVDWIDEKPVIDILETSSYPIEKVEFPTVTICPASSNSDRWGAVFKVFDHLDVVCPST